MLEKWSEREQCIPVEIWDHFDTLNVNLRMERDEIRFHYNV